MIRICFDESVECIPCFLGIGLVPVNGVDLFKVTAADLVNDVRNSLVSRMKGLKLLISENRLFVLFLVKMLANVVLTDSAAWLRKTLSPQVVIAVAMPVSVLEILIQMGTWMEQTATDSSWISLEKTALE